MKNGVSRRNGIKTKIETLGLVLCLLLLLPSEARLQSRKPMTIAELVTYSGRGSRTSSLRWRKE